MKLENENVLGVQTPPRKSYNPFESDDEDADAYTKSNIKGYDITSFETTADSLTFHLDTSDLSWEEAILGHSRVLSNSISADASNEEIPYRENTELFTDKAITECELPELEFSYKDNGFYSVKDIGIDEGVPTQDKVWIISQDSHNSKNVSDHVLSLTEDVTDKSRSDDDVKKDAFVQNQIEDSVNEGELVHEVSARPYSSDQCKTADFIKEDEDGLKHDLVKNEKDVDSNRRSIDLFESDDIVNDLKDPYVNDKEGVSFCKGEKIGNETVEEEYCKHSVPIQHAEKPSTSPSIVHEAAMESNENQSEVAPDQSVVLPALQEPVSNGVTNALSYNSKVESGSIILDFNAATTVSTDEKEEIPQQKEAIEKPPETQTIILDFNAATTVSTDEKEEIPQQKEAIEKPPETQTMSRDDGGAPGFSILDCATDKRVHGETSFSAAMPPPSSIIYMGPHANTGSISLRSESSTGSTRSFAFPVLQTEWNSSPVRMAKADQRHFRKQRGWVHFVCCKF